MIPAFDLNLLWAAAGGLVLGAGLVFLLLRRGGSVNRERAESLATELEETRLELESHREEVSKHFGETSDLFRDLTEQYTRLYAHLATGAREFCPEDVPSLGQGLDTPLLVDEAPEQKEAADAASAATEGSVSEESPEQDSERRAETSGKATAAADGDAPAGVDAAESEEERLAVDAPVPGAAPPPVASKRNGGTHLTH